MARTKSDFRTATQKGSKKTRKGTTKAACSAEGTSAGSASSGGVVRVRPGMRSLREIREYQQTTELLFKKASFQKLVREIAMRHGKCRFEVQALLALQEAAEMFMVGLAEDAGLLAAHTGRVTIMPRDVQLSSRLRNGIVGSGAKAYKSMAAKAKTDPASSSTAPAKPATSEETTELTKELAITDAPEAAAAAATAPTQATTQCDDDEDDEDDEDFSEPGDESNEASADSDVEVEDLPAIPSVKSSEVPVLATL